MVYKAWNIDTVNTDISSAFLSEFPIPRQVQYNDDMSVILPALKFSIKPHHALSEYFAVGKILGFSVDGKIIYYCKVTRSQYNHNSNQTEVETENAFETLKNTTTTDMTLTGGDAAIPTGFYNLTNEINIKTISIIKVMESIFASVTPALTVAWDYDAASQAELEKWYMEENCIKYLGSADHTVELESDIINVFDLWNAITKIKGFQYNVSDTTLNITYKWLDGTSINDRIYTDYKDEDYITAPVPSSKVKKYGEVSIALKYFRSLLNYSGGIKTSIEYLHEEGSDLEIDCNNNNGFNTDDLDILNAVEDNKIAKGIRIKGDRISDGEYLYPESMLYKRSAGVAFNGFTLYDKSITDFRHLKIQNTKLTGTVYYGDGTANWTIIPSSSTTDLYIKFANYPELDGIYQRDDSQTTPISWSGLILKNSLFENTMTDGAVYAWEMESAIKNFIVETYKDTNAVIKTTMLTHVTSDGILVPWNIKSDTYNFIGYLASEISQVDALGYTLYTILGVDFIDYDDLVTITTLFRDQGDDYFDINGKSFKTDVEPFGLIEEKTILSAGSQENKKDIKIMDHLLIFQKEYFLNSTLGLYFLNPRYIFGIGSETQTALIDFLIELNSQKNTIIEESASIEDTATLGSTIHKSITYNPSEFSIDISQVRIE